MRRDYAAAFKFFSLASQSGNVLAIFNLAQMRATGTGIGRDCRQAVEVRYFALNFYVLEAGIKSCTSHFSSTKPSRNEVAGLRN